MKVLVYGAGVIGCSVAHALCEAGNEVTLVARGAWRERLETDGLVIRHTVARKTTVDRPRIVRDVDAGERFDAVFCAMQYGQMFGVLEDLARIDAPLVVLVGNNLSAAEMERRIAEASVEPKTVLFGFMTAGGHRDAEKVVGVSFGGGKLTVGGLHRAPTDGEKDQLTRIFSGSGAKLVWEDDMEGWYTSHLAFILPIAYLSYATGCDLRKATRAQRRLLMDAVDEGFGLIKRRGIAVRPAGEDAYYRPGFKRIICDGIVLAIVKTPIGDLAVCDHCRHAVGEMEALDAAWERLRAADGDVAMPHWDELRSGMPAWDELARTYAEQGR
jgi:2-dehydropantoate 2-reductase